MNLKNLKLINFRNYSKLDYKFNAPVTVLIGNNAQGKSNFLEAIYFLATSKSSRAEEDRELIKGGENLMKVEGNVELKESAAKEVDLEITLQLTDDQLTKKVKVNGIPKRVVDYIGNLSVVSFSPEDINLVTGPPALRRWHTDLTLAQIDPSYKKALTLYEQVIVNKNRILKRIKEGLGALDELDYWLDQQLELAKVISEKRSEFFSFLNNGQRRFGPFQFQYIESLLTKERLEEYQAKEVSSGSSLIGPHRDDFVFVAWDQGELRDLRRFGSRGEHRGAVLDLKLSEGLFVEYQTGQRPILLLDDVFSELDSSHRDHVTELVNRQQTIIATVELDPSLRKRLKGASVLRVEDSRITTE